MSDTILLVIIPSVFVFILSYPELWTKKDGRVKFHPKSVNSEENLFANKFMIYHQKMKSSAVFIHNSTMIPPLLLLFFGGEITVQRDDAQEIIAVDKKTCEGVVE